MNRDDMEDPVDLELHYHYETGGAILVSENGDEAFAHWLPKSLIEWDMEEDGKSINVTVPEWLAKREGFI